ncbi:MAG TPA: magnesium transporter [Kiritimatiellia bacterium]|nr:magnesium transporter [Kiritimatiellia bacterium]HMP33461.1 magnesium transporter [Kiritimatiellia bacterium]
MSDESTPNTPAKQHPADIADQLEQLTTDEAAAALRALPAETASEVLTELDTEVANDIAAQLSNEELSSLLAELPHDAAADIAADLSPEQQVAVLAQLDPPESAKVSELMRYSEDSAGGIMRDTFIALPARLTVGEGLNLIRQRGEEEFQGVTYVYIVDEHGKLAGVVSIRDLVFRPPARRLAEVMNPRVHFVRVDTDQEEVARQFTQYHYMALPVVERDGRLVGLVEASQVIGVLQEEATEDMQLMVGVSGEESAHTPWRRAIGKRTPWLYVNLLTAFMAAAVIAWFENTLAQWTALAVFLPIIAGQGGNAGMQALTVTIRSMALGELDGDAARRVLMKELILGLLNGVAFGLTVGVIGYLWKGSFLLGLIVFLAMFLNMVAAAASGVLIPLALRALRFDPALSSSIFLTTVTDVAGFFFFLGLASLLIPLFGHV